MTSRERFKKTLNHEEPDRVPIEVGSDLHNGIHAIAYKNLLEYLGEKDEITYYDQMQHLAVCKESIRERLHADTRYIFANAPANFELKIEEDESWVDEWGVRRKNYGLYDENIRPPLKGCTMENVKKYTAPDPKDSSRFTGLRYAAKKLYETTDYALIAGTPASLFFLSSEIIGFQEYMERLHTDLPIIEILIEKILEYFIDFFDPYLDAIGDYIEMVWIGDDWGTQLGPIMQPDMFKSIFVNRYKELVKAIKQKSDVKVAIHSCGSVFYALQHFADAGIDVVHPLQGDASEMDGEKIKREFGDSLVLYSNISNQGVLPNGSPSDVWDEVKKKIKILGPGGGYIMSGGHNIQADVPPENIIALFDAAYELGEYPIQQ